MDFTTKEENYPADFTRKAPYINIILKLKRSCHLTFKIVDQAIKKDFTLEKKSNQFHLHLQLITRTQKKYRSSRGRPDSILCKVLSNYICLYNLQRSCLCDLHWSFSLDFTSESVSMWSEHAELRLLRTVLVLGLVIATNVQGAGKFFDISYFYLQYLDKSTFSHFTTHGR